ncbi:hypothetical protein C1645_830461 [Glomus cerebriforme]|uniref:Alpha-type protein kinase domain-containing protein n=1 Tax=Glomus cerebriforme TaxID=658196 RepID=A0A397SSL3_9GLOM|nr:hypothetical protein C1645_830461 [Glomus cerebriforme]
MSSVKINWIAPVGIIQKLNVICMLRCRCSSSKDGDIILEASIWNCLIPTVKSGQQGLMVWCFTKNNLDNQKNPRRQCANTPPELEANEVAQAFSHFSYEDSREKLIIAGHTARIVKSWKQENNIYSLSRPTQNPDLNPIEHL